MAEPREANLGPDGSCKVKLFTLADKREYLETVRQESQREALSAMGRSSSRISTATSVRPNRMKSATAIPDGVKKMLDKTAFKRKPHSYSSYNPPAAIEKYTNESPTAKKKPEFRRSFKTDDAQAVKVKAALGGSLSSGPYKPPSDHSFRPDDFGHKPDAPEFMLRLSRIGEFEKPVPECAFDRFNPTNTFKYASLPNPPKPRTRLPERGLNMHPAHIERARHDASFTRTFSLPDRQHRIGGEAFIQGDQ